MGAHLIDMHLVGVYLIGVDLIGTHLMSASMSPSHRYVPYRRVWACISRACIL
jgi:hypothetical protein